MRKASHRGLVLIKLGDVVSAPPVKALDGVGYAPAQPLMDLGSGMPHVCDDCPNILDDCYPDSESACWMKPRV